MCRLGPSVDAGRLRPDDALIRAACDDRRDRLGGLGGPVAVAVIVVTSAFAGLMDGTLASRFARVRVPTRVALRYALPKRKGERRWSNRSQ